jgi:hypothetical protein
MPFRVAVAAKREKAEGQEGRVVLARAGQPASSEINLKHGKK